MWDIFQIYGIYPNKYIFKHFFINCEYRFLKITQPKEIKMCYSAAMAEKAKKLEEHYGAVAKLPEYLLAEDLTSYHINGFAKQIVNGGTKQSLHPLMWILPQENPKFLTPLMWGFVPSWKSGSEIEGFYKESIGYGSGLNATSEKLFTSRHFMESALNRRCIVPVTGFFEPYRVLDVKKPFSIPFHFERKDKGIINLAGIYNFTNDGHATFAVLTKSATPLFEKIHHTKKRRPVILHDEQIKNWMDDSAERKDLENILGNDMPDELIFAQPISRDLYSNKVDTNRTDITTPVHYPEIRIEYEGKPQQGLFR